MIWYKYETPNGVYFTPFTKSKYMLKDFGNVSELANFVNNLDGYYEVVTKELVSVFDKTLPENPPQDLPNGIYSHEFPTNSTPERLVPLEMREDKYVELMDSLVDLDKNVDLFLNNKSLYEETSSSYKLGVLLFGPPGTGKTSYLREFIRKRKDAIVIFMDGVPNRSFLEKLESSTKNRLKIIVFEEAVSLLEDSSEIREMLDFLDGSKSLTNSIYFLSTNYPEAIPENVVRNGRIDLFVRVGFPNVDARKKLIKLYLGREGTSEEISHTEDMPIVDIREICFTHRKTSKNFAECVKMIEEKNKMLKKHFGKAREIRLT